MARTVGDFDNDKKRRKQKNKTQATSEGELQDSRLPTLSSIPARPFGLPFECRL